MPALLFTCPHAKIRVQHWLPDDEEVSKEEYEGVICQACTRVHFIDRNGEVMGAQNRDRL